MLRWRASYGAGQEVADSAGAMWFVVIATLQAAESSGWGDITVGAAFNVQQDLPAEKIEEEIAGSEALETLYDFARSHLDPLLRTVGSDLVMPRYAPDVVLHRIDPPVGEPGPGSSVGAEIQ